MLLQIRIFHMGGFCPLISPLSLKERWIGALKKEVNLTYVHETVLKSNIRPECQVVSESLWFISSFFYASWSLEWHSWSNVLSDSLEITWHLIQDQHLLVPLFCFWPATFHCALLSRAPWASSLDPLRWSSVAKYAFLQCSRLAPCSTCQDTGLCSSNELA